MSHFVPVMRISIMQKQCYFRLKTYRSSRRMKKPLRTSQKILAGYFHLPLRVHVNCQPQQKFLVQNTIQKWHFVRNTSTQQSIVLFEQKIKMAQKSLCVNIQVKFQLYFGVIVNHASLSITFIFIQIFFLSVRILFGRSA